MLAAPEAIYKQHRPSPIGHVALAPRTPNMVPDACRVGVQILRTLSREIEVNEQGTLYSCVGSLVARLCLLEGLPTRSIETGLQQSRLGAILPVIFHTDELRIDCRAPARPGGREAPSQAAHSAIVPSHRQPPDWQLPTDPRATRWLYERSLWPQSYPFSNDFPAAVARMCRRRHTGTPLPRAT